MLEFISPVIYLSIIVPVVCSVYITFKRSKRQFCPYCNPLTILERSFDTRWYCKSCNGTFFLSTEVNGEREWVPIIPDTSIILDIKNSASIGNGLCRLCNHHQSIIVHFLSQLECPEELPRPRLEAFLEHLEQRYPLCASCQYIVQKRLASQNKKLSSKLDLLLLKTKSKTRNQITLLKFLKNTVSFVFFSIICLSPHALLSDIACNRWLTEFFSSYEIYYHINQIWTKELLWITFTYTLLFNRIFSSWERVIWCFIIRPKVGTLSFSYLPLYINDDITKVLYCIWIILDFIIMRRFKNAYIPDRINVFAQMSDTFDSDSNKENQYSFQKSHPFSIKHVQLMPNSPHKLRPSILSIPPIGLEDSFASFGINERPNSVKKDKPKNTPSISIIIFIISIILITNLTFSQPSIWIGWIQSSLTQ